MIDLKTLELGKIVEARFTNSGQFYAFKAQIVKINKNSISVVKVDGEPVYEGDSTDRRFNIPIIGTLYNGIFELSE